MPAGRKNGLVVRSLPSPGAEERLSETKYRGSRVLNSFSFEVLH